jgi:hypothetical protein
MLPSSAARERAMTSDAMDAGARGRSKGTSRCADDVAGAVGNRTRALRD